MRHVQRIAHTQMFCRLRVWNAALYRAVQFPSARRTARATQPYWTARERRAAKKTKAHETVKTMLAMSAPMLSLTLWNHEQKVESRYQHRPTLNESVPRDMPYIKPPL